MEHRLDTIDLKILDCLQNDGRISNTELAEIVGLSPTPCARRVRILEDAGFFKGTVTLIEPEAVGLAMTTFVQITLNRQKRDKLDAFEAIVSSWPEVLEVYLMTGDYDYLLKVLASDLKSFQAFMEKLTALDEISHIKSSFALKHVASKTALPLPHVGSI